MQKGQTNPNSQFFADVRRSFADSALSWNDYSIRELQIVAENPQFWPDIRKRKVTPHKRFSKMIFLNAKNSEIALLAEPHGAVMFSCRTSTFSAKVSCRTLEIAEPKALNLEKDNLAEPWNAGSFRVCPRKPAVNS